MRYSSNDFITSTGKNLLKIECSWPDSSYPAEVFTFDHLKSFTYSANGTSSNSMQLGLASICSVAFAIINTSGRWNATNFKGAKLTIFLGKEMPDGDEYVKMGIFTVEDAVKNEGIINISASDNMAYFDTRFKGIPFPCTIRQLLAVVCLQAGVLFVEPALGNLDFTLDTLENVTALTCREVLSLACELLGGFGIINSDGNLEIRWFNTNQIVYRVPEEFVTSCKPGDAQIATGISAFWDGEEIISGSSDAFIHLTDDNVLVRNVVLEEKIPLVESIFEESISQLTYDPGTIDAKGLCVLEPGDVIQFDYRGKTYKYIIAALKLTGNLKMSITSTAPSQSSSSSGGISPAGNFGNNSSGVKTVYMLSYEDVVLPLTRPYEVSRELVSVSITKSEGHVPIAMFTSIFTCTSPESETAQVKFTLYAGSAIVHEFIQRCHSGANSASFSWPLINLPTGATRISVVAETLNAPGTVPNITWLAGDTSLIVFGRGFNISSVWNGLLMASDTFNGVTVNNSSSDRIKVTQMVSEVHSQVQAPKPASLSAAFIPVAVGLGNSQLIRTQVSGLTESVTIEGGQNGA